MVDGLRAGTQAIGDGKTPRPIADRLGADERLLWWDQPEQGPVIRPRDIFLIPFSLLWAGVAFFLAYTAMTDVWWMPWYVPLLSAAFIIAAIYLVIGRFFHDARRRSRLFYGLTDHRVIIATQTTCVSLPLNSLGEINLNMTGYGSGSISFGYEQNFFEWITDRRFKTAMEMWIGTPVIPTLERVGKAQHVLAMLREAQDGIRARTRTEVPSAFR